jgi:O-antigen/teichoic acid export membrane protein
MIYGIILAELLKFVFVAFYSYKMNLIKIRFNYEKIKEQIVYTFPMGISNFIFYTNKEISKFFIIYTLGVEYLAFYAVGSYQIPIINIVRGSIADIVFPEICSRMNSCKENGLILWKKTNILYCAIVFPFFIVFFYYSENFIRIFFTDKYIESIPVFRIYMFLMLKECFETGIPLRSIGKNRFYVIANVLALMVNIALIFILKEHMRFYGPAIAYLVSDSFIYLYFGIIILNIYNIRLKKMFYWDKILKITIINILLIPVLLCGELVKINYIAKPIIFSSIFFLLYFFIISRSKIEEVDLIVNKLYFKIKSFV